MADETIGINLSLDMDAGDLDRAIGSMTNRLEQQFGDAFSEIEKMIKGLNEAVRPMTEMANMAKKMSTEFEKVKKDTDAMRQNVASTRLQVGGTGQGIASIGGGGIEGGGLLSSLFGGGLSRMLPMLAPLLAGGGVLGGAGLGMASLLAGGAAAAVLPRIDDRLGISQRMINWAASPNIVNGVQNRSWFSLATGLQPQQERLPDATRGAGGELVSEVQQRNLLMGIGAMRGIGQGPLGMFANVSGTRRGYEAGRSAMESIFPMSTGMQRAGGAIGAYMMPSLIQNYAQDAMSRYQGYLQTSASMATVGMYGGNLRQIMRMRPARFGYGPGEIGPEFSGLFQGYGGGDLTEGTQRTAMAYSRAYGVNMGQIGQAMGGLINVGGGGQSASAAVREQITMRVMADAVAEGFGRRLPEYAQAVGSSMQNALSGPALVGQSVMPGLISVTSRLTGQVAGRQGLGLEAAGRLLQPLMGAPQNILEGMFSGRGDPYQMAMYWGHNRQRFGGDPMRMMEALEQNAATPFSREALQFQRGPLQEILRASPNDAVAVQSLRQLMPNISFTGARQVVERGREAMERGGGSLEGVDMQELFTGVEETEVNEAEETRDTMRDIQRSGERIMNEQLGMMRANASFQMTQYGLSASMAEDARKFYRIQVEWTRIGVQLMRDVRVSADISAATDMLTNPDLLARMNAPGADRIGVFIQAMMRHMEDQGVDLTEWARNAGFNVDPRLAASERVAPIPVARPGRNRGIVGVSGRAIISEIEAGIPAGIRSIPAEEFGDPGVVARERERVREHRQGGPKGGGTDFKGGLQRLARVTAGNSNR